MFVFEFIPRTKMPVLQLRDTITLHGKRATEGKDLSFGASFGPQRFALPGGSGVLYLAGMNSPVYRVRRATVDDLEGLRGLWRTMNLPAPEFERRITEYQVVESTDGCLHGALGLEISARQGRLHGEVFSDFALADSLRELLWQRMQALGLSHGLARLWTQETAPFWKQQGFQPADGAALKKFPETWAASDASKFFTVALRDEESLEKALAANFELLKEEERRRTEKFFRRGKTVKFIVTVFTVILALFVAIMSLRLFLSHLGSMRH
jgi:N-acetylglutamate synthase-like GNAT family acetyltransferase